MPMPMPMPVGVAMASPPPVVPGRAPAFTYWVEYKNEEGKPYYHNSSTKQTVWDMPAEYRAFVEARAKLTAAPPPARLLCVRARGTPPPTRPHSGLTLRSCGCTALGPRHRRRPPLHQQHHPLRPSPCPYWTRSRASLRRLSKPPRPSRSSCARWCVGSSNAPAPTCRFMRDRVQGRNLSKTAWLCACSCRCVCARRLHAQALIGGAGIGDPGAGGGGVVDVGAGHARHHQPSAVPRPKDTGRAQGGVCTVPRGARPRRTGAVVPQQGAWGGGAVYVG
jgi:hypothetical protein